jgi:hypothetical protein
MPYVATSQDLLLVCGVTPCQWCNWTRIILRGLLLHTTTVKNALSLSGILHVCGFVSAFRCQKCYLNHLPMTIHAANTLIQPLKQDPAPFRLKVFEFIYYSHYSLLVLCSPLLFIAFCLHKYEKKLHETSIPRSCSVTRLLLGLLFVLRLLFYVSSIYAVTLRNATPCV